MHSFDAQTRQKYIQQALKEWKVQQTGTEIEGNL